MQAIQIGFNSEYAETAPSLDEINDLQGLVLLEFGAPWCGHCQASKAAVEEVMKEHPKQFHIKIFDGKGKRLGRQFGVKLWPTLILLRNGREIERLVRFTSAEEVRDLMALGA
ncbi:thioredoxin family protein [Marinomonas sp.]|uniref:thioredoxin family protein n=1 Tax=Marinomonas sp. TaxID=1904862 RepID=UPI003BAB6D0C